MTPGFAQTNEDDQADVNEIVVTATRRATSLADTPLAVSVFSGDFLANGQIDNPEELQFYTPGLVIADYGVPQIYIRGVGTNTSSVGADASATIHLDGVYLARPYPAFLDFVDVERVEVLRGPQGTLYGRNSTAGTINVISRAPTMTPTGQMDVTYGSKDQVRARASLSGPIIEDKLAGRASFLINKRDGYYTNVVNGERLDDENTWSARAALEYNATDNLTFTLRGDFTRQRETGGISKITSSDPMLIAAGAIFPQGRYDVALNDTPHLDVDFWGVTLDTNWDLGGVTLRSISAFRSYESDALYDTDGTNLGLATAVNFETSDTYSQELQIITPASNRLSFIGGLYFFSDNATNSGGTTINPGGVVFDASLLPPEGVLSNFDPGTFLAGFPQGGTGFHQNKTKAYAAFAEATYSFTDSLRLTAGVRYSYEEKTSDVDAGLGLTSASENWDALTPRFVAEWNVTPNALLYASVAKGFKSGGFNAFSVAPFDPEYVWNRELGLRASLFEQTTDISLSAFDADYKAFQVQVVDQNLTSTVVNAGRASTRGVELELNTRPTEGLAINAAVTWLDATYDRFSLTDITAQVPVSYPPYGVINFPFISEFDQAGQQMFNAPDWMVSAGAQQTWSLPRELELTARVEYQWQDEARTSRLYTRDAFDFVNLSLTLNSADDRWSVTAFGRNVFDTQYVSYGSVQAPLWGRITSLIQGDPAIWGVQVGARF